MHGWPEPTGCRVSCIRMARWRLRPASCRHRRPTVRDYQAPTEVYDFSVKRVSTLAVACRVDLKMNPIFKKVIHIVLH